MIRKMIITTPRPKAMENEEPSTIPVIMVNGRKFGRSRDVVGVYCARDFAIVSGLGSMRAGATTGAARERQNEARII